MDAESLKTLGVAENLISAVLADFKTSLDGNFVPKATFDAEREKVKARDIVISERDTQLQTLGTFKGTAETLQAKVNSLQIENSAKEQEYQQKMAKMEKEYLVRDACASSVIDPDDVISRLDLDKITVEKGSIKFGLSEQLETLKTLKPHYFKPEQNSTPPVNQNSMFTGVFSASPGAGTVAVSGAGSVNQRDSVLKDFFTSVTSGKEEADASEKYYFGG